MILELAGGKCYMEKINLFKNDKYSKCIAEVNDVLDKFGTSLPKEEGYKLIMQLEAAQSEVEAITADEYFKQGFKLGLILAAQNFLE